MHNIILHDSNARNGLLPLVFTKPVAQLRIGILTIKEKYQYYFPKSNISYATEVYLKEIFSAQYETENIIVNACFCINENLKKELLDLPPNQVLTSNNNWIALKLNKDAAQQFVNDLSFKLFPSHTSNANATYISRPYHLFLNNAIEIENDFKLITSNRQSQQISATNKTINAQQIFVEPNAYVEHSILNASAGSIYVGAHAEIMEGSVVRGALALGEHAVLKLATKIYGATTIGPHCKVGGEVNNSIITAYSNKAHDGFLGNAVIGEWCNLGADTNNSNLKNNYANVKLYNYQTEMQEDTQLQFCGLIMADHSKCGINTMFNTGTVVGVSANVFGAGFPATFIPSFTWGGVGNNEVFKLDKSIELAQRVYARRNMDLSHAEQKVLQHIYENTKHHLSE